MSDILFLLLLQIEDSPRQGAEFMSKVARIMVKLQMWVVLYYYTSLFIRNNLLEGKLIIDFNGEYFMCFEDKKVDFEFHVCPFIQHLNVYIQ